MNTAYVNLDNGKQYYLDIEAIVEFVSSKTDHTNDEVEKMEVYEKNFNEEINMTNKQVREVSVSDNSVKQFRFEILRPCLEVLFQAGILPGENGSIKKFQELDAGDLSIGETIAINTLIKFGFLKEIA